MPRQTSESLNIKVHEEGSSDVITMFNKIATAAETTAGVLRDLRAAIGGVAGTVKEAQGRGNGASNKAVSDAKRESSAVKNIKEAEIRKLSIVAKRASEKRIALIRGETIEFKHQTAIMKIEAKSRLAASAKAHKDMDALAKRSTSNIRQAVEARVALEKAAISKIRASEKALTASRNASDKKVRSNKKVFADNTSRFSQPDINKLKESERSFAALKKASAQESLASIRKETEAVKSAAATKRREAEISWSKGRRIFNARRTEILKLRAEETKSNKKVFADSTRAFTAPRIAQSKKNEALNANAAARAHRRAARAARSHGSALDKLADATHKNSASMRSLGNQVFFAQRAFAALGGAFAVSGYLRMSDQFQNMTNRIRLVTTSADQFAEVQSRLQNISRDTRQSLTATTETYVRLRLATKNSGVAQERLFGVMTTLNQMLAVSGTTAIEAEQSIRQLSQAFSKGKLDGDEFRSVSEAMPSILTALEKSLGKTRGELRDMSEAGKLTTEVLITAFETVKDPAMADFGNSVVTLGQAFQVLKNEILVAIGNFNESSGVMGVLTTMITALARNLWVLKLALQAVAAYAFVKSLKGAKALASYMKSHLLPTIVNYKNSMKAASTDAFIGPRMQGGTFFNKGVAKSTGLVAKMSGGVARLTAELGLLNSAALLIGAGIISWNLGSAIDDWLGISDAISEAAAGVDSFSSKAGAGPERVLSDMISHLNDKIAQAKASIDSLSRHDKNGNVLYTKNIGTYGEQKRADIVRMEQSVKVYKLQVKGLVADREKTAELLKQKHLLASAKKYWSAEAVKGSKILKARRDITKEFEDAHVAMQQLNIDYADQMRWDLLFFASASKRVNMLDAEVKKRNAILDATKGLSKREQAIVRFRAKNKSRTKDLFGDAYFVKDSLTKVSPGAQKTESGLNSVSRRELNRERSPSSGGGSQTDGLAAQYDALLESLNPLLEAQHKLLAVENLLKDVSKKFPNKDTVGVLSIYRKSVEASLNPLTALSKATEQNAKFLGMSATAQQAKIQLDTRALALAISLGGQAAEDLTVSEKAQLVEQIASEGRLTASNEHKSAIESLVKSLEKKVAILGEIKLMEEAIGIAALSAREKEVAWLNNILRLYPNAADAIKRYKEGTLSLTDAQYANWQANNRLVTISRELDAAVKNGATSAKEAIDIMSILIAKSATIAKNPVEVPKDIDTVTNSIVNMVQTAYKNMEQIAVDSIIGIEGALLDLVVNSGSSWDDFTSKLKGSFKSMANSILQDITRILVKMAVLAAIEAISPGATAGTTLLGKAMGRRHGGTIRTSELPRYAHGGGFTVGGFGGPDTKLIQFMASPGENVHITNPGQSRLDNQASAPMQAPAVNITNVVDPSQMAGVIASPAGRRAILNVIQQEGPVIRKILT